MKVDVSVWLPVGLVSCFLSQPPVCTCMHRERQPICCSLHSMPRRMTDAEESLSCSVNQYRQPSNWGGDRVVLGLIGANVAGWVAWQSNPDFMSRHAGVLPCTTAFPCSAGIDTRARNHEAMKHMCVQWCLRERCGKAGSTRC